VRITDDRPDRVLATVAGTIDYDVVLDPDDWSCPCPVGIDGLFCKHLVATVLVATGDAENHAGTTEPSPDPDATEAWLAGLSLDDLRQVVDRLVDAHPEVYDTLDPMAARATGDVAALEPFVDSLRTRGYLEWRDADEHGRRAEDVVAAMTETLDAATAAPMLPLIEKAFAYLVRTIHRSDDSSGIQGDAVRSLLDLHARAARLARPDPVKLARWLVKRGIDDQDLFDIDPVAYAEPLGERGVAAYRPELGKRLGQDKVPFLARWAEQRLAVLARDVPEVIRLVGGDLEGPHRFIALVEALREIDATDEALQFALEGTRSRLVPHQTIELYDAAARLLDDRGERDAVLKLRREQLTRIPTQTSYASLRRAAESAGRWPEERLAALDVLLQRDPHTWLSTMVKEGQIDVAWDAARTMELPDSLWLTLLRARAKEHPEDVYDGYVGLVERTLVVTDKRNYRTAVGYLGELGRAASAAGRDEEYADLVRRLLETHRRRPTLVRMLERLDR
jgi:uncharacterized Zn finger protein